MDKEAQLLQIAEEQQGYFTSRQAEECGFSRTNFHRKLKAGKWLKEEVWGVYRLANYPITARPELALWMLWSADKKGRPQGVWSHETALDIHELSDVSPSKLHMSVPRGFRKRTSIPKNLSLHPVDPILPSEIENRHGYRVTTPLRTLADVIRQGTIQYEQLEKAILDLAIKKSLIKGLSTIQEMKQLQKLTDDPDMQELIANSINDVWGHANVQLADLGRLVEPYTVGLMLGNHGFGAAVLCQRMSHYFLLTSAHVGMALHKTKNVKLLLRFDAIRRESSSQPSKSFKVIECDNDLAMIIPSKAFVDALIAYKAFYTIPEAPPSFSLQETLISFGGNELKVSPYALVASDYRQTPRADCITCPQRYDGFIGSGLWKFVNNTPYLVGIAIEQDPPGNDARKVYFRGPQSIFSCASILGKTYEQ